MAPLLDAQQYTLTAMGRFMVHFQSMIKYEFGFWLGKRYRDCLAVGCFAGGTL
jgi:hypothetical protein